MAMLFPTHDSERRRSLARGVVRCGNVYTVLQDMRAYGVKYRQCTLLEIDHILRNTDAVGTVQQCNATFEEDGSMLMKCDNSANALS